MVGALRGRKKLKQVGRSGAWRHEILRMAEAANASDVDDQPFWNEVHVGRSRHVFLFSPLVQTRHPTIFFSMKSLTLEPRISIQKSTAVQNS